MAFALIMKSKDKCRHISQQKEERMQHTVHKAQRSSKLSREKKGIFCSAT